MLRLYIEPVLVYALPEPLQELVKAATRRIRVSTMEAEHVVDFIVQSAYLAIIDPSRCSRAEWQELCDCIAEMDRPYPKFLLTTASPHDARLPHRNLLPAPDEITTRFLQDLIVHERSELLYCPHCEQSLSSYF